MCGFSDFSFYQFTNQVKYVAEQTTQENIFPEFLTLLETFSLDPFSVLEISPLNGKGACNEMYSIVISTCIQNANSLLHDINSQLPNPLDYGPTPFHGCIEIMKNPEFSISD